MSEEVAFRYNLTRLIINSYIQNDDLYWETIKDYIRANKNLIFRKDVDL